MISWFVNRRVRTKLAIGFGSVLVMTAALGLFAIRELADMNSAAREIADNWLPSVYAISNLDTNTSDHRLLLTQHVLSNSDADKSKYEAALVKIMESIRTNEALYEPLITMNEKELWKTFKKDWAAYLVDHDAVIRLSRANKQEDARAQLAGDSQKLYEALSATLLQLVEFNVRESKVEAARGLATYLSARTWTIGIVLAVLAVGIGMAVLTTRLIAAPMRRAVEVLNTVADGDLTLRMDADSADEIGRMAVALNRAVDGMRAALQEVSTSANQAASASVQLSAASEQMSFGVQEQASSLEETAASLEEITGTVTQNADNARQASQLAVGSRDVAEKGRQAVTEAIRSMKEINQSSKKIADIITTIDEIAFQTNLLALNAAVEAARAGEQGRGFAVVASEVRNLAQRSATAAKEIKGLIQDSVAKVEAGSELVNRSGETLTEIVGSVKRVTDIIAEIAAASQEQAMGINQVNVAVMQLDQVTQSNAAQTEELSSTAQALAGQAGELQAMIGRFKLGDDGAAGASWPVPPIGIAAARPAAARPVPRGRRALDARRGPVRKTDEVLMTAVPPASNGKGQHKDDSFQEF